MEGGGGGGTKVPNLTGMCTLKIPQQQNNDVAVAKFTVAVPSIFGMGQQAA